MERITKKKQIEEQLLQFLAGKPEGARYSEIINHIIEKLPGTNKNTIIGLFQKIIKSNEEIEKFAYGVYRLKSDHKKSQKKPNSVKSQRQKIIEKIKKYLNTKKEGARYSEILQFLQEQFPNTPRNTLIGTLQYVKSHSKDINSPHKGYYILNKNMTGSPITKHVEEDFYEPFADYLVNELEECTKAIPLGGNKFQDKWGTPDVLGVYKFSEADPIKPPLELISAEIKLDTNQVITAFGQACAYKIFSHKVYLVVPRNAQEDIPRLESLCMRFGIGLIVFDPDNSANPNFEIRTRALKSDPDYHYVNNNIQKLTSKDKRALLG